MNKYKIGLEVHVQVKSKYKLFTTSKINDESDSNENVSLFDISYPGTFCHINEEVIKKSIIVVKMLNCTLSKYLLFDRKHYFYPDLPSGYQITQHEKPIGINGNYNISDKYISINNIHIECDAGKTKNYENKFIIDYNRVGIPLLEIVTDPCFENEEEIECWLLLLAQDLKNNNISDIKMEKGHFRIDLNVSRIIDEEKNIYTCRYEVKNLNSIRYLKKALKLSKEALLNKTEKDKDKTIFFDEINETIFEARNKEKTNDYLYMIEPSLYPIPIEYYKEENINFETKAKDNFIKFNKIIKNITKQEICILSCNNRLNKIFNQYLESQKNLKECYKSEISFIFSNIKNISNIYNSIFDIYCKEFVNAIQLLINKKIIKIELQKIIDEINNEEINENFSIEKICLNKKVLIDEIDFTVKDFENLLLKNNKLNELYLKYKNGQSKIGVVIGEIRKIIPNIHPIKIKELIDKN